MEKPVCVVIGVGPGNGAAITRRFAAEGYATALVARRPDLIEDLARHLGPPARAYCCDAGDRSALERTLATIEAELGAVDVLVYNAGSGVWGTVEEITPDAFESTWRVNGLGALVAAQHVIPAMKRRRQGTIVYITRLRGDAVTTFDRVLRGSASPGNPPSSSAPTSEAGAGTTLASGRRDVCVVVFRGPFNPSQVQHLVRPQTGRYAIVIVGSLTQRVRLVVLTDQLPPPLHSHKGLPS